MNKLLGKKAPSFTLPDQDNLLHSLKNYLGNWVIIYFYPKDDTPGCTKEACSFRDNLPKFKKLSQNSSPNLGEARWGITILGISADSVSKHKKFSGKYDLNFTLLADEDKKVVNSYKVWQKKKFMGREYMGIVRTSFLIDPKGKIVKVYEGVKPDKHVEEVLADLKTLTK